MSAAVNESTVQLDLSDLDRWVGKPVVFAEFWDPCSATDIRRWVQAMDYANPLHWDEEFAKKSRFGGIVAPLTCEKLTPPRSKNCPSSMTRVTSIGPSDPTLLPAFVAPILAGEADYTKGNRLRSGEAWKPPCSTA